MTGSSLVLRARRQAGLSQGQLAARMGTTQSTIARLEQPGANPTLNTLDRVIRATGHKLEMRLSRQSAEVDEAQILERLALTPRERLAVLEASQRKMARLRSKARRVQRAA